MVDPECCGNKAHLGPVAHRACNHLCLSRGDKTALENLFPGTFCGRFALPGKRRFVAEQPVRRDQPAVGRYCIAGFEEDEIADHKVLCRHGCRVPVADDLDGHLVAVGIEDIELAAAPVFVVERDAGGKEDRNDNPDGI